MGLYYLKLLVLELLAVMLPLLRGDQLPLRHLYLLLWVQDQLLLRLDQLVVKLPLPLLPPLLLSPSMPLSIIMLPIPLLLYYAFYPAMYAAIALACSVPSTLNPPFTTLAVLALTIIWFVVDTTDSQIGCALVAPVSVTW